MHRHVVADGAVPPIKDIAKRLSLVFAFLTLLMVVSYVADGMTLRHNIYMDYTIAYTIASIALCAWTLTLRTSFWRIKRARPCAMWSLVAINIVLLVYDVLVYMKSSQVEDAGDHSVFFVVLVFSSLIHIIACTGVLFFGCATICLFLFFRHEDTYRSGESLGDDVILTAEYEDGTN